MPSYLSVQSICRLGHSNIRIMILLLFYFVLRRVICRTNFDYDNDDPNILRWKNCNQNVLYRPKRGSVTGIMCTVHQYVTTE